MVEQNDEYTEQADKFLKEHGIGFDVEFVEYGKHFADDKDSRNIYDLTLSRGDSEIVIRFGQSIADTKTGTEPTAYDLLACVTKSDPGTFEDFCADFGYDEDSRKAYATYESVCKEWQKVEGFFSPEELEQLQEIN